MSIELKIKAKHLALEPAIIRHEERKLLNQIAWKKQKYQVVNLHDHPDTSKLKSKWWSLNLHRKYNVRNEARATHLARAYIAGMPYKSVESKRDNEILFKNVIMPRILSMVAKYGEKKIYKKYNRSTNVYDYDPVERETLIKSIEKWAELE